MDTFFPSARINPELQNELHEIAQEMQLTRDQWGNAFWWVKLATPTLLPQAAQILAKYYARLCTVTALSQALASDPGVFLDYHFDVAGAVVTVITPLDPAENSVPTITPWFKNADWNEREAAELYDIHVEGNTQSRRLFLDESIDQGILNEVIPLSIMMNGACTKDLWEHITAMNLSTAPHSVFPQPEGPAENWPPLAKPGSHQEAASPLPPESAPEVKG